MSLINISNLTFAYEGSYDNIFEDASFQIDTDWKLGLTGRNGRGKTTLLNLLLAKYEFSGSITSSVAFEYFPFEVEDTSILTFDVIASLSSNSQDWELTRELSLLKVSEDVLNRPFVTLSNGEQTKVLLATLFLKENSFLLIDEPTNHLDLTGRQTVSRYLNSKQGFILVSHDRAFLDSCIDHILTINRTNIEVQKGNFSSWWENKRLQDQYELAKNKRLKKDITRLNEASKRVSHWSDKAENKKSKKGSPLSSDTGKLDRGYLGHKAAKMMKRSKTIEERQLGAAKEKSKLLKNIENADNLKLFSIPFHKQRLALLDKVTLFYGEKKVCENVCFTLEQGDMIALRGKNGSGKSSILKLICGDNIRYTGNFELPSNLIVSYVPQDTISLCGNLSDYADANNIDESLFKTILRKLDFSRPQFEKDMSDYSAGQKKKVWIAKSLCEQAHLYVWDEPLNFIDVLSRMQIEELLLSYKPTILFVEHDSAFCDAISSKTVAL